MTERTLSDLSPEEIEAWALADPDAFYAAVGVLAREIAAAGFKTQMRRQRAEDWRRLTAPLRWLWNQARRCWR